MRSRNKEPVGGDTGIDQLSAKQRWEHSQQQSDSTGHHEHGRDRITIHQMFHEANLLKPALFLPLPATKEWGEYRGAASQNVPPLPGPLLHPMEEREFFDRGFVVMNVTRFTLMPSEPNCQGCRLDAG